MADLCGVNPGTRHGGSGSGDADRPAPALKQLHAELVF
jgi:hypothetical protein